MSGNGEHLYQIQGHACPNCGAPVGMEGDDYVTCTAGCGYRRQAGDEDGRQEEREAFVSTMQCPGCD